MSDKKYSPREAAIAVLKKAEELYSLSKAKVDEGKSDQEKAWARSGRNDRHSTETTTWEKPPSAIGKVFGQKPSVETQEFSKPHAAAARGSNMRIGTAATPGHGPKTASTGDGGTVTSSRKVVGTPQKSPNIPNSRFKSSDAIGKSEEAPMKGHIKLAKFVGRMEAKRGKPLDKGETGHEKGINSAANFQVNRPGVSHAGISARSVNINESKGGGQDWQGRNEAKDRQKKVLGEMKAMPKPKLPG